MHSAGQLEGKEKECVLCDEIIGVYKLLKNVYESTQYVTHILLRLISVFI